MGRAERRRELKKNEKLKKPPVYNYTPESLMGQLKYEANKEFLTIVLQHNFLKISFSTIPPTFS